MTDRPSPPKSQAGKILACLQAYPDCFVAMPDLAALSGSLNVHSRIADLRRRGHHIENRTYRDKKTGLQVSEYMLRTRHIQPRLAI